MRPSIATDDFRTISSATFSNPRVDRFKYWSLKPKKRFDALELNEENQPVIKNVAPNMPA
jgi:hypothetical protein